MGPFPSSLAVYLSNRCNRACSYCYVAVNRGAPAALDFARLKRALDYFLSRAPVSERKVSFLGGEPLLDYPLVCRAVDYLRDAAGGRLPVHLFTNGTLLDRRRLEFLLDRGVDLVLSEDGERRAGGEDLPKRGLSASFVITPESAARLSRRVHGLYLQGFRRIAFSPDANCLWSARDAARLETALDGFGRYYKGLARGGAELFELANIYEVLGEVLGWPEGGRPLCDHLILAADGRFYACDKMLSLPLERLGGLSVGSPEEGLDFGRRESYFEQAFADARQAGQARWEAGCCPVGACSLWRFRPPRSREGLSLRLASFREIWEIFRGALSRLARQLKDDPGFRRQHHVARGA